MIVTLLLRQANDAWVEPGLDILNMFLKMAKVSKSSVLPDESPKPANMFETNSILDI